MKRKFFASAGVLTAFCFATAVAGRGEDLTDMRKTRQSGAYLLPPKERDPQVAAAFIGSRRSIRGGERSALRWLSRLLKQQPHAKWYAIEYWIQYQGLWFDVCLSYEHPKGGRGELSLVAARNSVDPNPPFRDTEWNDVDEAEIRAVARKGGTLKSFARYEVR